MLLLIDFLSLRAREYTFLTRMFQEWEVSWQQAAWPEKWQRGESWFLGLACCATEPEVSVNRVAL